MQHQETGNMDHLFLKGIGEGVLVQDGEGQVISADAKAAEMLHTTIEDLKDRNSLYQLWKTLGTHEQSMPFEDLPPMKALRTGKTQRNITMEIKTPENELKTFVWNARPLFTSHQSVPFAVVSSFTHLLADGLPSRGKTTEAIVRVIPLSRSIEQLLNETGAAGRFQVKFSCSITSDTEHALSSDSKLSLFQIGQEAMTNIVQHSHAGSIRVNIMQQNSGVILYIYDDGRGFDGRNIQMGSGLSRIYTEVKAFNGVVDIVTAPGKGCSVTVLLPVVAGRG
jgi:hypothetical protein